MIALRSLATMALLALLVTTAAQRSDAAVIGIGAFGPSAVTTDFDGLGLGSLLASPVVIGGHTISTQSGVIRYQNSGIISPPAAMGEQVGTNTDRDVLTVNLANPSFRAGLLVSGFDPTGWTATVEYFDSGNQRLGTDTIGGIGLNMTFSGFESNANPIDSIVVTDTDTNSRITVVDNLIVQAVPEPSVPISLGLFSIAIGLVRRSRR